MEVIEQRAAVHAALGDTIRLRIVDALALTDRTPSELTATLGVSPNLLSHHLAVLKSSGVVRRSMSHADGRRTYLRLEPSRIDLAVFPRIRASKVVFVCTHNSARSQLAAALWAEASGIPATSVGYRPANRVHPGAVAVAARHGIDISSAHPRGYSELEATPDLVISVCDRANEADWPFGGQHLHWSIADPSERGTDDAFAMAFDEIAERIAVTHPHVVPRNDPLRRRDR